MQSSLRRQHGYLAILCTVVAGCAQPAAESTYHISQIDSSTMERSGTIRVRLTTDGTMAEADAGAIVNLVKIIAVHEATKRQKQIADERARAAYRRLKAAGRPGGTTRYLAVVTEKDPRQAGGKAVKSVMIWDTQSETVVGNNVYDVASTPAVGNIARFETYSATYVGGGN